ncbi:MAG: glycoside hydrolase, partial [Bilifractor sp.]
MQIIHYQKISDSQLEIRTDEGLLIISAESSRIMRCVYTRRDTLDTCSPIGVHHNTHPEPLTVTELDNALTVSTSFLTLWIGKTDCRFVWSRKEDGYILLEEGEKELTETPVMKYTTGDEKPVIRRVKTVDGERNFVENLREVEDHRAYHAKLSFKWKRGEQIHGLGQGEEGIYNYRGHVQYLYQHNMRIPIPFLVSDRGYAILADCGSLMTFNDDERGSYLYADVVEQLDYYFIAGNTMDDLIDGFRCLTGKAAMLPKWAFGYV